MTSSFIVTVQNKGGLHARPCGVLVQYIVANNINAKLGYAGKEVDADSILDLLSLCAPNGAEITVYISSPGADAGQHISALFINQFGLSE
ncbi:MAG: HPr family phosphocarrier protein [Pseudomonadota bacterium]